MSICVEMHRECWATLYRVVTIGEASGVSSGKVLLFVDEDREELDMLCEFEGIFRSVTCGKI